MYRILLFLCFLEAMAFDSDEAKYIDLLPEAEKQEFLNRIARRILEEIQSQGTPLESQEEVTNDQLDAHEAYVQDILKEESDNLRNEKREISQKAKDELGGEESPSVNEDRNTKADSVEDGEKTHIDLTLRDGEKLVSHIRRLNENQNSNDNPDTNNDSSYSVIPVNVVYDKDKVKGNSTTYASLSSKGDGEHSDKTVSGSFDQQFNDSKSEENKSNFNEDKLNSSVEDIPRPDQSNKESSDDTDDPSTQLLNDEREETVDISSTINPEVIQTDSNNFQISEEQLTINSDKEQESTVKINNKIALESGKENEFVTNIVPVESTIEIENGNINENDDVTNIMPVTPTIPESTKNNELPVKSTIEIEKGNINESDDVTNIVPVTATTPESTKNNELEGSTKTDRYAKNLNISPEESNINVFNDQSTLIPLTTELNTLSDSNNFKTSKDERTTTIKGLTMNPDTKHYNKDKISGNKKENERPKKYYRKKLKILSEDYSVEEVESFENNDKQNIHRDNADRYLVYEISEEKPAYIQKGVPKDYEQPYYIPIYNFAPNNAYYNPYNHLGPNAAEKIEQNPNSNDIFDEELFTRNGFQIDIRSDGNKKAHYKYPKGKIMPNPREYIYRVNPNLDETRDNYNPYVDTDYFYYPKKARRQISNYNSPDYRWRQYLAGQQSLAAQQTSNVGDLPDFNMDRNIEKLVYGLRRRHDNDKEAKRKRHKKKKLGVRELPNSSEEDHPYYSIHKGNMKDHVRAVRKLLYKQKKFGFMPPTPYAIKTEPRYKRMMGPNGGLVATDNESLSRNVKGFSHSNTNNIAWDYYWGRLKKINYTNDFDDIDDELLQNTNTKNENTLKGFLSTKVPDVRSETEDSRTATSDVSIDDLINVLRDMIRRDNQYLVSYNWLQTAVETNGAINKLLDLTNNARNGKHIHSLDLDLLKYVIDSYISSKDILKTKSRIKGNSQNTKLGQSKYSTNVSNTIACLLARMRILPKTKRRKPGEKIKNPLTLWNAWNNYYINRLLDENSMPDKNNILADFKDFLIDLQDNLYELHNALKRIAVITTYRNQNWYQDLKSIFLKAASRRRLQQVLLHLGTSKLVDSIENSMKRRISGSSVKNNKGDTRRTQEYFVFVLTVLDVMNGGNTNQFLRECRM